MIKIDENIVSAAVFPCLGSFYIFIDKTTLPHDVSYSIYFGEFLQESISLSKTRFNITIDSVIAPNQDILEEIKITSPIAKYLNSLEISLNFLEKVQNNHLMNETKKVLDLFRSNPSLLNLVRIQSKSGFSATAGKGLVFRVSVLKF